MLNSVQIPHGPADEEALHRYRLAVKRDRYAAEFAPKTPESTQLLAGLKRLQDALSSRHEWVMHDVTPGKYRQAVSAVSRAAIEPPRIRERAGESKAVRKREGKGTVIEGHTGRAA